MYIFSQKKTQLSCRETYKHVTPILQAHSRHSGALLTEKDKRAKKRVVKTHLDAIQLTISQTKIMVKPISDAWNPACSSCLHEGKRNWK
jgi:hypothetical protein